MLRITFALAAALVASTAGAAEFKLDAENTKITFVGTKKDGKHEGGFKKLEGTASVSGADLSTLKLELEIPVESLYSDDAKLTGHLKSPDFFNAKEFPTAKFKLTKVEQSEGSAVLVGDLTMLGKTKEVKIPSQIKATDSGLKITSDFNIERSEWGMSYGKGKIDEKVKLKIDLNAKK